MEQEVVAGGRVRSVQGVHATRAPDALSAPTAFTTRDLSARSPQISQELRLWCYTANPQEGPFQDSGA